MPAAFPHWDRVSLPRAQLWPHCFPLQIIGGSSRPTEQGPAAWLLLLGLSLSSPEDLSPLHSHLSQRSASLLFFSAFFLPVGCSPPNYSRSSPLPQSGLRFITGVIFSWKPSFIPGPNHRDVICTPRSFLSSPSWYVQDTHTQTLGCHHECALPTSPSLICECPRGLGHLE